MNNGEEKDEGLKGLGLKIREHMLLMIVLCCTFILIMPVIYGVNNMQFERKIKNDLNNYQEALSKYMKSTNGMYMLCKSEISGTFIKGMDGYNIEEEEVNKIVEGINEYLSDKLKLMVVTNDTYSRYGYAIVSNGLDPYGNHYYLTGAINSTYCVDGKTYNGVLHVECLGNINTCAITGNLNDYYTYVTYDSTGINSNIVGFKSFKYNTIF